jgi:hypothetical protein
MSDDQNSSTTPAKDCKSRCAQPGVTSGIYGLAFIGAVVYYVQQATSFWQGAWGVLKAMIWPALLIYKLLEFFKM